MRPQAADRMIRLRRTHGMAMVVCVLLPLACDPGIAFHHESPRSWGAKDASTPAPPLPAGSWTLVALPDTQNVVSAYPEILYSQTAWIAANADTLNIKYVVHEGDITNDSSDEQWATADHAFRLLDSRVPFAPTMGNHDYPGSGGVTSRDSSQFDTYFPPSRLSIQPGFVGMFDPASAVNAAYRFEGNGQAWLVIVLEFGPRDDVLAWADSILAANSTANAILVTHAYLFVDGTRFDHVGGTDQYGNPHDYNSDGRLGSVNDAQEMWDKLIAKNPQIRFVLCGHMHAQARLDSKRVGGPPVHQLLADYQVEEMGGSGYLRVMTFTPDGRVLVRTYSPFLQRFRSDEENDFVIDLENADAGAW